MLSLQGCTSHRSLLLSLSTKWFQTLVHKECSRHFQNTLHKKTIFSTKKSRLDKTKPRYNYNNPHSTLDGSNIIRNMPIQICWKDNDFNQFYKETKTFQIASFLKHLGPILCFWKKWILSFPNFFPLTFQQDFQKWLQRKPFRFDRNDQLTSPSKTNKLDLQ